METLRAARTRRNAQITKGPFSVRQVPIGESKQHLPGRSHPVSVRVARHRRHLPQSRRYFHRGGESITTILLERQQCIATIPGLILYRKENQI
jgi:hypothetical protein